MNDKTMREQVIAAVVKAREGRLPAGAYDARWRVRDEACIEIVIPVLLDLIRQACGATGSTPDFDSGDAGSSPAAPSQPESNFDSILFEPARAALRRMAQMWQSPYDPRRDDAYRALLQAVDKVKRQRLALMYSVPCPYHDNRICSRQLECARSQQCMMLAEWAS